MSLPLPGQENKEKGQGKKKNNTTKKTKTKHVGARAAVYKKSGRREEGRRLQRRLAGAPERLPGPGGLPIWGPAFGEGATVEEMKPEGVKAGDGAACPPLPPAFPGGCGGRLSAMMVTIMVGEAV